MDLYQYFCVVFIIYFMKYKYLVYRDFMLKFFGYV